MYVITNTCKFSRSAYIFHRSIQYLAGLIHNAYNGDDQFEPPHSIHDRFFDLYLPLQAARFTTGTTNSVVVIYCMTNNKYISESTEKLLATPSGCSNLLHVTRGIYCTESIHRTAQIHTGHLHKRSRTPSTYRGQLRAWSAELNTSTILGDVIIYLCRYCTVAPFTNMV